MENNAAAPSPPQASPLKKTSTPKAVVGDEDNGSGDSLPAANQDLVGSKRERKQTNFLQASDIGAKLQKVVSNVTEIGTGAKLGENAVFVKELNRLKGDDELLKSLHSLFYGTPGKRTEIKKMLRNFSGFPPGVDVADKVSKVIEARKKWTVSQLKQLAGMLGVEKGGDRNALAKRVVEYLASPTEKELKASRSSSSSGKKAKSSSTKNKKSKKTSKGKSASKTSSKSGGGGAKTAPSAFMLFSAYQRKEVKTQNPEMAFGEISSQVGNLWKALSDAEKLPWNAAAAAAKAAIGGADVNEEEEEEEEEAADGNDDDDIDDDGDVEFDEVEAEIEAGDGAEDDPFDEDD